MTKHMLPMEEEMSQGIPLRRLGRAEDAAGATLFLCSQAGNYLCGHTLALDGGMIAQAG